MTSDTSPAPSAQLSEALRSAWGKSTVDQTGRLIGWLPLTQHLEDAAAIAGRLWDGWLPPAVRRRITDEVGDEASARALVVWLAAGHDSGKLSPAFAVQVPELAQRMLESGLPMDPSLAGSDERRLARHELVSYVAVDEWLVEHGFDRDRASRLASIVAAHHGNPPSHQAIMAARRQQRLLGDEAWRSARDELITAMSAACATPRDLDVWRAAELSQPVLVTLTAVVIVADWIASSDLFRSAALGAMPPETTETRSVHAWRQLDLPPAWAVPEPPADDLALFGSRFRLPEGATPRPVQSAMMDLARTLDSPALVILEAEMGVGKTEAALAAAEILAHRFGLGGLFIGLPTQATADGMFVRILDWANRLDLTAPNSVHLAHGRAQVNEAFAKLTREAYSRAIRRKHGADAESPEELAVAHVWLGSPRRGPLANLVIGTIDQALFAALRSKYLMLRHLALAGKVVVLDEVHAYDAFTGQYLERLLHWLGAHGVPVVMLSATLPSEKRRAFVRAYDHGRASGRAGARRRLSGAERREQALRRARYDVLDGDIGYPSIVVSRGDDAPAVLRPHSTGGARRVELERLEDDPDALVSRLRDALGDDGHGNIAVIRNTVRRVQETAASLRAAIARRELPDVEVIVAHARFLALDRAANDRRLLELYGRKGNRPAGSIVVASQVIEQSLDLDFDLMVTDLAPVDLLMQRAGRLHRHDRARPTALRTPRIVVTGVDWAATPPQPDAGSAHIYHPHLLLRTLAVLDRRTSLNLPEDIPTLVQSVYGPEEVCPDAWAQAAAAAHTAFEAHQAARRAAADEFRLDEVRHGSDADLLGWVHGSAGDPSTESRAQGTVRDGDPTLEVIVLQRGADGILRTPEWLGDRGGLPIPSTEPPDDELTRTILGCVLRLPAAMCRGTLIDRHITALERAFDLPPWHASRALKGELVLELDADGHGRLDPFELAYTPENGLEYRVQKGDET